MLYFLAVTPIASLPVYLTEFKLKPTNTEDDTLAAVLHFLSDIGVHVTGNVSISPI